MKSNFRKARVVVAASLLGFATSYSAIADDIEIYVGAASDIVGVRPNILFILDTSGSMDTNVVTQTIYDPSITYDGPCDDDNYYARSKSYGSTCYNSQRIEKEYFVCNAAISALESIGYYQDRLAQYRDHNKASKREWRDDIEEDDRVTECEDDAGVHGLTAGSSEKYPANGSNGPYTNNTSKDIKWNDYDVHTIYSANYLNWKTTSETIVQTRLEIMQSVFKDTLDSINNVNVGLMRFDRDAQGGMIVHEIANLATARTALKAQIDAMTASGNTPLAETLYEAGLYYMGMDVDYGDHSEPMDSVDGARNPNDDDEYQSPIEFQCQRNFIVYLTDGEPTSDDPQSKFATWPAVQAAGYNTQWVYQNGSWQQVQVPVYCNGNCLDEIAGYLYNRDLNGPLSGAQNAITYTIGFATDQKLLEDAAKKGGGKYYTADDTAELTEALTQIIADVLSINTTFTAPAVSVNAFNRTVHLDQLFFTVFKPDERPHWDGNLKRFDLGFLDGNPEVQILDASDPPKAAVDANTGFFAEDALSFWTLEDQAPDGGEARLGGAAGALELPRKVYTYGGSSPDLAGDDTNLLHEDNDLITKAALGIDAESDDYRDELLRWARGIDVFDDDDDGDDEDGRRVMGDPLHSKPVVITYGGSVEEPDITIYMTTNDGYLHAIDASTGEEHFAFVPPELWENLDIIYTNNAGVDAKVYGLDSPVTPWVHDANHDGIIDPDDGDHVYVYFGQRRGGDNYYALDVTDRENPQFMWSINSESDGYGELGQTWSAPRVARVVIDDDAVDVLIFGGGYDTGQDIADNYVPDEAGRAVFMADAETGELLWWAGPTGSGADLVLEDLENSIPSEVRVIDMNADGFADRMYVGDMGGRVFRFDIINGEDDMEEFVRGAMIAAVGAGELESPTTADNRKFFHPPDPALIVEGDLRFINIAIGSGNQDHPLGKVNQDRLFSIRDWSVDNVPAVYPVVTTADLYDATENLAQDGDEEEREAAIEAITESDGWYIDLVNTSSDANEGEKALAEAVTVQGKILFTTFTPVSAIQAEGCAPSQGVARVYELDAVFATAIDDFDDDDATTREDRAVSLVRGGIPPEATVLFPEATGGQPIAFVGPERIPLQLNNIPVRTYWYDADNN